MRLALVMLLAAGCAENRTPPAGADAGGIACLPDLDGRLEAHELPLAPGATGRYEVRTDVSVDLAGVPRDEERRRWSFPGSGAEVTVTAIDPARRWYAGEFPGADLAIGDGGVDAVYALDERGLHLLGLASEQPDPPGGRTLLAHDRPVPLLLFPLERGAAWEAEVGTSGELDGLPFSSIDTYRISAPERGEVELPGGLVVEDALRVDVEVQVAPTAGGQATGRRQTSFYFECAGEIARAVSRPDETERNFDRASELRLLAF